MAKFESHVFKNSEDIISYNSANFANLTDFARRRASFAPCLRVLDKPYLNPTWSRRPEKSGEREIGRIRGEHRLDFRPFEGVRFHPPLTSSHLLPWCARRNAGALNGWRSSLGRTWRAYRIFLGCYKRATGDEANIQLRVGLLKRLRKTINLVPRVLRLFSQRAVARTTKKATLKSPWQSSLGD